LEWQSEEKDGRELLVFNVGGNRSYLQVSVYPNEREEWGFDANLLGANFAKPVPIVFWKASSTKVRAQEAAERWYEDAIVCLASALG